MSATDPVGLLNITARLEGLMESVGDNLTEQYDNNPQFRSLIQAEIYNGMERGGKDAYLDAVELFEMTYLYGGSDD